MKNYISVILFNILVLFVVSEAQSTYFKAVKLDNTINSNCDETAPVLSNDGKTMFFARSFCIQNTGGKISGQDVWFSKLGDDGKWSNAEKVSDMLANKFENAPVSISEDGNKLYVTNSYTIDGKMAQGMSVFTKSSTGAWEAPSKVTINNFELKKKHVCWLSCFQKR